MFTPNSVSSPLGITSDPIQNKCLRGDYATVSGQTQLKGDTSQNDVVSILKSSGIKYIT